MDVLLIGVGIVVGVGMILASLLRQQNAAPLNAPSPFAAGGGPTAPASSTGNLSATEPGAASLLDQLIAMFSGNEQSPPVIASTSTAPSFSQKVQKLMEAIAYAEGFGVAGTVPTRAHNPGDLGPGDCGSQWPVIHAVGSDVCQLPDDATGWNYLQSKVARILSGTSGVYSLDGTFTDMARKYAGDWQNWSANVGAYLGINPNAVTLRQWLQI